MLRDKKIKLTKFAGICGIMVPIVIFSSIFLALFRAPWFKWTNNALSDLGVEGISAFFFNNGLIFGGILSLIFSFGLAKILKNKLGVYILSISSIALIGIGLFPIYVFILHFIFSATFFILLTVAFFIIGISLLKYNHFKKDMGIIAITIGFFAIISPIFLKLFSGIAVIEAMVAFPALIWFLTFGIKMIKHPKLV